MILERGFIVTEKFLTQRVGRGVTGVSKWIKFCRFFIERGYTVSLYEAVSTRSKYITVHGANDVSYTTRISDHPPSKRRELAGDCDFFVGVTHTGVRTTGHAAAACLKALGGWDEYIREQHRKEAG